MHKPTQRVLDILLTLSKEEKLKLSEIAQKTHIPISTLFPIIQCLQNNNFIFQKDKYYSLGNGILSLKNSVHFNEDLLDLIKLYMKKIRDVTGQTCQLGILQNNEVLYLEKIEAKSFLQLKSFIGTSYPAYATALGKALLSKKTKKQLYELYPNGLKKITPNTITKIEFLYEQLQEIEKQGFAMDCGEMNEDIECIAISIENKAQKLAAISVSYLVFHSSQKQRKKIQAFLLEQKNKLEFELKTLYPHLTKL